MFAMNRLLTQMEFRGPGATPQVQLLFCLSTAHRIYRALPNATLTTRALNKPMQLTKWGSQAMLQFLDERDGKLRKATAFSCVAYMETGMDIDPAHFDRVFAIAYEDSIYVSMQVSRDATASMGTLMFLRRLMVS